MSFHASNYSFTSSAPFQNYGINILSSAFVHQNAFHLFINLLFLIPLIFVLRKNNNVFLLTLRIHLFVLLAISLCTYWNLLIPSNYFGLSHIVFALLTVWAMEDKKFLLPLSFLGLFIYEYFSKASLESIAPHFFGLIAGLIESLIAKTSFKKRP
jgi:membrane associated rhomboid family serine protease